VTDPPRPSESVEQRLALVARGVQRMADAFGSLEHRLATAADADRLQAISDRIDEYRVRSRSEMTQVSERIERIEADQARSLELLRAISASLEDRSDQPVLDLAGPIDRLIGAVRALRDDIAVAIGELRTDTAASIERISTEQHARLARLHDELAAAGTRPGPAAPADERLAAIERVIASLRDELAIDRLEASMRDMAEDTSGLRADVRRSFDRVLHEITTSEEALRGEVRAIDGRLAGFGEDLRLVRGLRDGLEALASGVDAVRQLAARGATSSQMADLAGELSMVLAEIESARTHVLSVDQQVGQIHAAAIDVEHPTPPEVRREVEDLERKVTGDIADLGARIDAMAERAVAATTDAGDDRSGEDPLAARLRSLATSARQLSQGIAEDLKARRGAKKRAGPGKRR